MGLLDFAREIGQKLFSREDEASSAIQKQIEKDNPGIEDLKVDFNDGVVSISGNAASAEAMQKAVLMAGNIQGVAEVNVEGLAVESAQGEEAEYYIIQKGDTLSKIAKQYYGDPNKYPLLFEANREVIRDPDLIFPGQKIRIPTVH
jgi:nucleoid-associated protein YgaU